MTIGDEVAVLEGQLDVLDLITESTAEHVTAHTVPESVRRLWGIPAENDLPPFWDGVPVTWLGWKQIETTMDWHLPLDHVACTQCGGLGEGTLINPGTRPATEPREGWAAQLRDIYAFRCPHCGHDHVHDLTTGESWDLDETDYGDEGSTEAKDTLF